MLTNFNNTIPSFIINRIYKRELESLQEPWRYQLHTLYVSTMLEIHLQCKSSKAQKLSWEKAYVVANEKWEFSFWNNFILLYLTCVAHAYSSQVIKSPFIICQILLQPMCIWLCLLLEPRLSTWLMLQISIF